VSGGDRGAGNRGRCAALLALIVAPIIACGVKGPPQPPLVRLPAPPGDLVAERRADRVEIRFVVPGENTDGSRPANIERVDVYALTGPSDVSDELLLKRGVLVASVQVKAPRDPDDTVNPGDPIGDAEPPEGPGLDQSATAQVYEDLAAEAMQPADLRDPPRTKADMDGPMPLTGPPSVLSRTFVGVGVSTRGRLGTMSRRAVVTMLPAPLAPPQPDVTYDEKSITVMWTTADAGTPTAAPGPGVLPARTFGMGTPMIGYHVYDVTPPSARSDAAPAPDSSKPDAPAGARLTEMPVPKGPFVDTRIEWGAARCYTVRVVRTFNGLPVEGDAASPRCTTLTDTFAPAAPTGVTPIPSEGAITLIWNPNTEPDLAGYIVLRSPAAAVALSPLTPAPVQLTTLRDAAASGARFFYAVQAIDKAGNVSPASVRVDEAAR